MSNLQDLGGKVREICEDLDELEELLDEALYQIKFYDRRLQEERMRDRELETPTDYCFHETGNVVRRLRNFLGKEEDDDNRY